ncbi:helix-hairpin-helix protein [Maribacter vaceletii]|uniref:Helix-hairpin-helix protein n=1 Tax=Maribacter vaceletii TaxID=1206816 RepID=A0A495DTS7_9FLAO|nr:helix-hairpin-helix domain-containing protein [Maribacter vaceletii]RKR07043.1 helix-hairpin-helix protein [Maribacter vaceletii]
MKNIKSRIQFSKQEQSGIFFLLLFIVLLQGGYYLYDKNYSKPLEDKFVLNLSEQNKLDLLKKGVANKKSIIHPFNPNFISDYKGYTLGMSVDEINRLHTYRKTNKYVNTAIEFQQVTKISDSLLKRIQPYFKFPEWKQEKTKELFVSKKDKKSDYIKKYKDLNIATSVDLREVYGIGEVLSKRIVKYRKKLGGFSNNNQIYKVYGLKPDVANRLLEKFQVLKASNIKN